MYNYDYDTEWERGELRREFPRYQCAICGTRNPDDHDRFCGMQDVESGDGNDSEEDDE